MGPIKRRDLIKRLRDLGFEGPYSGGRHEFMRRNLVDVRIPNPHQADIRVDLLKRILNQAGIEREEWENT
jgi:predicted RNA binding protein YcfA (HicA-like mRNA interferase family)